MPPGTDPIENRRKAGNPRKRPVLFRLQQNPHHTSIRRIFAARRNKMLLILLIVLILVFGFGGYRMGPGIGYYGGGGISLILAIVLILLLLKVV